MKNQDLDFYVEVLSGIVDGDFLFDAISAAGDNNVRRILNAASILDVNQVQRVAVRVLIVAVDDSEVI